MTDKQMEEYVKSMPSLVLETRRKEDRMEVYDALSKFFDDRITMQQLHSELTGLIDNARLQGYSPIIK